MSLTSEEREALEQQFREELEAQHDKRLRKLQERQERSRARRDEDARSARAVAESDVKDAVRQAFYKEHGYKLYVDSTGREHWLAPEEYEHRVKRRRGRARVSPTTLTQRRVWAFYGVVVVLAILLGVLLAR